METCSTELFIRRQTLKSTHRHQLKQGLCRSSLGQISFTAAHSNKSRTVDVQPDRSAAGGTQCSMQVRTAGSQACHILVCCKDIRSQQTRNLAQHCSQHAHLTSCRLTHLSLEAVDAWTNLLGLDVMHGLHTWPASLDCVRDAEWACVGSAMADLSVCDCQACVQLTCRTACSCYTGSRVAAALLRTKFGAIALQARPWHFSHLMHSSALLKPLMPQ